jgi:hypothetical protein
MSRQGTRCCILWTFCLGIFFPAIAGLTITATPAWASCSNADWTPGSRDMMTCTIFTVSFAKKLRGFQTLEDLGRAAHAPGHRDQEEGSDSFRWTGTDGSRYSSMLATKVDDLIAVQIVTDTGVTVILNNQGAWQCAPEKACAPVRNNTKMP